MSTRHRLRIGAVASAAGMSVDAVRYYERLGLLEPSARTEGGFRTYEPHSLKRLAFILQAKRLGLTLREIRELVHPFDGAGRQRCERVHALILKRVEDIESQMTELKAFRRTLRASLAECEAALGADAVEECPVVRSLTPGGSMGRRSQS